MRNINQLRSEFGTTFEASEAGAKPVYAVAPVEVGKGALIAEDARSTGEYFCVVERVGKAGHDEMTVTVEVAGPSVDAGVFQKDLERRLHEALAVKLAVKLVQRGELDQYTGVSQVSKVKRLLDKRQSDSVP